MFSLADAASQVLPDLTGQPWYVVLGAVAIAAGAWAIPKLIRRSSDSGEGQRGLRDARNAADYLGERAVTEATRARELQRQLDQARGRLHQYQAAIAAAALPPAAAALLPPPDPMDAALPEEDPDHAADDAP